MRILIITDKMDIGGAETHVFTLIKEMRKYEVNMTLICAGGTYAEELREDGVRYVFAPLDKRDPLSIKRALQIIEKEMNMHDIVHAHTRLSAFLAKRARRERDYPPIIATAHLNFPLFPFGPLAFWGDRTLAVSRDIEDYLTKNYKIPRSNITLTKNAIDTKLFSASENREKIIVHTSRIDKGRATTAFMLAKIAEKLLSAYPSWRIVIVGSGNRLEKLRARANEVNRKLGCDGIILTGARSDIYAMIKNASIFVGVSRSALEGMASGICTVLCGDEGYGGIVSGENFDKLASTNFCARDMPPPNENMLLADIEYLINNEEIRSALGSFLRSKIALEYEASLMAQDAYFCYKELFRRPKVCLIGFFGYLNLGDEEMLAQAIGALAERGVSDFSLLYHGTRFENVWDVRIKTFDRMNPYHVAAAINSSDAVIFCGGNLLQNETSNRSLLYYSQMISYARRAKKRIYMLSSGFGELHGAHAEFLLARGIGYCDFCGCRTEYDLNIAKKYCEQSMIMPDLCFLLPEVASAGGSKQRFAWIVSRRGAINVKEIKRIALARGLEPIVVILYKEADAEVYRDIARYGMKHYSPTCFLRLKDILHECAFTVSERLHGAIFSLICHVPSYISGDSRKNLALLGEVQRRGDEGKRILLLYAEDAVLEKKEIEAKDFDFHYIISDMKRDIKSALDRLF